MEICTPVTDILYVNQYRVCKTLKAGGKNLYAYISRPEDIFFNLCFIYGIIQSNKTSIVY